MALHSTRRLIGLAFLTTVFNSAFAGAGGGPLGTGALPLGTGSPLVFTEAARPERGYTLHGPSLQADFKPGEIRIISAAGLLDVRFPGSNPASRLDAIEPSSAPIYVLSGEQGRSQTARAFGAVKYHDLYPGIDMIYRVAGSHVKSEFIVGPGADPGAIRIAYDGASTPMVDASGTLVLRTSKGEMRESGLNVYQEAARSYSPVEGRFKVFRESGTVGFELGMYDHSRALIIDPTISFSTYFGGSGSDAATAVAVDAGGNIYITGWTASSDLPVTSGAIQASNRGGVDAFVAKFNPTGSTLLYCTYLGGSGDDRGMSIAVDAAGNAYVAGATSSANFPVTGQSRYQGGRKAFVAKLSPAGNQLIYSTYLGGSNYDVANGIAVDSAGDAFVAGATYSTDFPVVGPIQAALAGQEDAFVAELDSTGTKILFSTYLGGQGNDSGAAIALDASGNVYVTGGTGSPNFPVVGAIQSALGGSQDAFVAKLNPATRTLVYSTYLGGSRCLSGYPEYGAAIDVDTSGAAYVTGITSCSDFPVENAFQPTLGGFTNAFLAKLNATGSALVYSTYLGGRSTDQGTAVRVNATGSACVAGATGSSNFPLSAPLESALSGLWDAFVSCFTPAGNSLSFSTYLGGSGSDAANGLALSGSSMYVVGYTQSMDFPLTGAVQTWNGGAYGAFVVSVQVSVQVGTDLAVGKSATESSTYGTYYAALAVDGNTDGDVSHNSVSHTNSDPQAWWQVDLGASASIDNIAISNRTDCCSSRLTDYWIFVSDTPFLATDTPATLQARAGTWSSHQTSMPNPSTTIAVGASGRYVRVQLSGTGYLSLAEVQVFGSLSVSLTDLAVGKSATESSTYGTYYAALAVDGNTDGDVSHNSVSHTNSDPQAWWQVDLGASASIDNIAISNRTDCCSSRLTDYWIFVSDTPFLATDTPATLQARAGTWSSHQTSMPNPSTTIAVGASGRYVRVQLSGTGYLSLAEVQVFGSLSVSLTDLAVGKSATESSTYGTYYAAFAVDGNTDGDVSHNSVSHTNSDPQAWWQVDLGASASIDNIAIWNRTDCCSSRLTDYWIFVSDTPFLATHTPATLQARAGTWSSHQTSMPDPSTTIPVGASGRYVRVQLSGTGYLSLAEVQVFGAWE